MKSAALSLIVFLGLLTLPACAQKPAEAPADAPSDPTSQTTDIEPTDLEPTKLGAGFASRPDAKGSFLQYEGGEQCISAEDTTVVFKNKQPKRVRWWVDPERTYHWEIVFVPKPDAQTDYFGAIEPVGCNDNHTTSDKHSGVPDDATTYYWYYKVLVYECEDGEKGEFLCESPDPRVGIRR